jgi:uncharacterized protein (DUF1778 family)
MHSPVPTICGGIVFPTRADFCHDNHVHCAYTAVKKRSTAKSQRINFRASVEEERLIRLGAEKRSEKVTRFIVQSACTAAEVALADQKYFELAPTQFARLAEALDRPAKLIPSLQQLFAQQFLGL